MKKEYDILFSLLRSALWGVPAKDLPKELPWKEVIVNAKKQTVLGLVCDALQTLPRECMPPANLLMQLKSSRIVSIKMHSILNSRLAEVLEILRNEGVEPVLFKGQGLADNYPDPTARQCGDIDLYVGGPNYEKACQVAIKHFGEHERDSESVKHYHLKYEEVVVELHRIAERLPGIFSERNYQRWTLMHLHGTKLRKVRINEAEVTLPPYQFDCIYILNHFWHHFMTSGVGLRQVCDWTMYLHRYHKEIDVDVLERDLRSFRLKKVWLLFSDIAVHYLGLPEEECPLYGGRRKKVSEAALEFIFSEGNFGHHSDRKRTPRPKGYTAGKLHTFRNLTTRYIMLLRFFPVQTFRFYMYFMLSGIYYYIHGLLRRFVNV